MRAPDKAQDLITKCSLYSSKPKEMALMLVNEVLAANPHSNPLNTLVTPTMQYWRMVRREINKIKGGKVVLINK